MAASSRAASIALFALALLCQPCAAADADCQAEEREDEAALLQAESAARRSAARQAQAANGTGEAVSGAASQKCGVIYIANSWTCCLDAHGNGIGAAPGSTCCLSPVTGGVLACGAGSVCNPNSGLCFAPGSQVCGAVACAPGTECVADGVCVTPGTTDNQQLCGAIFIADSWTCCLDAHGNGIGAAPGSTCCLSPRTGGVLACGAGSVCNPSSGLCFAPGSSLCGDVACAPGTVCTDQNTGICVVPGTAGTAGPTDSAGSEVDDSTAGSEADNSTNGTAE